MKTISSIPKDGKWHESSEVKTGETGYSYIIGPKGKAYKETADKRYTLVYNENTALWESPAVVFKIPAIGRLSNKYNGMVTSGGYDKWCQFGNDSESYAIRMSDDAMMRKSGNDISALNVEKNTWEPAPGFDPAKQ